LWVVILKSVSNLRNKDVICYSGQWEVWRSNRICHEGEKFRSMSRFEENLFSCDWNSKILLVSNRFFFKSVFVCIRFTTKELKQFTPKQLKCCNHLLTFMLFQTCIVQHDQLRTKKKLKLNMTMHYYYLN